MIEIEIRSMRVWRSVLLWAQAFMFPAFFVVFGFMMGIAGQRPLLGAGVGLALAGAVGVPIVLGMAALLRAATNGHGAALFAEAGRPFGGRVEAATLLWPTVPPRLTGRLRGREVVVDLVRLTTRAAGRPWILTVGVSVRPGKMVVVASTDAGLGADHVRKVLGLTRVVSRGTVNVLVGDHPAGRAFADHDDLEALSQPVFDLFGPCFVRIDRRGARVQVQLEQTVGPEEVGRVLETLCDLGDLYEATIDR